MVYIPSVRIRDPSFTSTTPNTVLHIHCVSNLDASCYGPVTAIEYCYRYSTTAGSGQVTFSSIVLILEDTGNNFMINSTYNIQSRGSVDSPHCDNSGDQVTCCDVTNIIEKNYPAIKFYLGVITSAQGNTPGVTLLGFYESEYAVN